MSKTVVISYEIYENHKVLVDKLIEIGLDIRMATRYYIERKLAERAKEQYNGKRR